MSFVRNLEGQSQIATEYTVCGSSSSIYRYIPTGYTGIYCIYCTHTLYTAVHTVRTSYLASCTTSTYYSTTHIIYSSEPRHGFSFRMATTHTGLSVGGSSSVFCSIFLRWSIGDHKRRCCNSHKCRRSNVRFEDPLCDFSVQTA